MRFEDERYVRVYLRDTVTWISLPWEARALFLFLLRKCDRAGLIDVGRDPILSIRSITGMPKRTITRALGLLIEVGSVELTGETILIPRYLEAQESTQSDCARKAESRAKARAKVIVQQKVTFFKSLKLNTLSCTDPAKYLKSGGENVTKRDFGSRNVTQSHKNGQNVTPSLTYPNQAKPISTDPDPEEKKRKEVLACDRATAREADRKAARTREPEKEKSAGWFAKALCDLADLGPEMLRRVHQDTRSPDFIREYAKRRLHGQTDKTASQIRRAEFTLPTNEGG